MVDDFTIKSEDVDNLVRTIRTHADAKALRRELSVGLNRATKNVRGQMIDAIPNALPRGGGLAEQFKATTSAGTTSAKSGKYAGVSIRFRNKGYDIRTLTGQRLKHPVFGNRGVWVEQTAGVDPDAFAAEFEKQKPDVQRAIVRVLEDVARKVTNI
jgi:hypothetical protein